MPAGYTPPRIAGNYETFMVVCSDAGNSFALINGTMVQLTAPVIAQGSGKTLQSSCIYNGIVYLLGGNDDLGSFQSFDPKTNIWTALTSCPTGLEQQGFAGVNNKLYAIGGNTGGNANSTAAVNVYDLANNTWGTVGSLPLFAIGQGACVAYNNMIYYQCGQTEISNTPTAQPNLLSYDPATDTWLTIGNIASPGRNMAIVPYANKIWITGGNVGGSSVTTAQYFDLQTNVYVQIAPMITALDSHSSVILNDELYVIGGSLNNVVQNKIYIYNFSTGRWRQSAITLTVASALDMLCVIIKDPVGIGGA